MNSPLVYKHPLRLTHPIAEVLEVGPHVRPIVPTGRTMALIFEPRREGWECMACAETYGCGVKPLLKLGDLARHAEAHQMGLDYALTLKQKGILK